MSINVHWHWLIITLSNIFNRAFEDEVKARMGVVECAKHELVQPFSVLHEKEGECSHLFFLLLGFTCFNVLLCLCSQESM